MEFGNANTVVNIGREVQEALTVLVVKDSRIFAEVDRSSPSAAAALAYMKEVTDKDGLCGIPTEAFLESILAGRSREEANAEATKVYLDAYNRGERLPAGGPGVTNGNPCAVAGGDYVKAIVAGKI